jgi:formate dehydrogenase alpha subunit
MAFGSGAMTNSFDDLEKADCILVIGSNTTENHPIIAIRIKRAVMMNDCKLILAEPRHIRLCYYASIWMRQRPGTDVALINGMMHVILEEGLADEEFISQRTEGFAELRETVKEYAPEKVAEITGVDAETIREAARTFATAESAAIVYSMGITQHVTGVDNVLALANLAMLTGNIGREGTGVNPLRGQNNVQGACDMGGLPNVFPGYQAVDSPEVRRKFEEAWGVDYLPGAPGLTLIEMMEAAHQGKIKVMYIMGENPVLSDPDLRHVRESLKNLDFLVVQDIFPTETIEFAHVVLPAACFAEKEGTFTNTERRVQRVRKAVPPPGEAREDSWIIAEISRRLGYDMGEIGAEAVMREIASLTPSYAGINYRRLEEGGLQWPCPSEDHPGTPILHVEKFTRGKGLFHPVVWKPPAEEPDEEYPLVLTTGRLLTHYHTGSMTRRVDPLNQLEPRNLLWINPEDAGRYAVKAGEEVVVESRRGAIRLVARVTDFVPPGVLFIPFHFRESPANVLTHAALDPISKIPEYKVSAVRLVTGEEMDKAKIDKI